MHFAIFWLLIENAGSGSISFWTHFHFQFFSMWQQYQSFDLLPSKKFFIHAMQNDCYYCFLLSLTLPILVVTVKEHHQVLMYLKKKSSSYKSELERRKSMHLTFSTVKE